MAGYKPRSFSTFSQNPANTQAELNNCIGGLLHLGPNIITFRTVITLLQQPLG